MKEEAGEYRQYNGREEVVIAIAIVVVIQKRREEKRRGEERRGEEKIEKKWDRRRLEKRLKKTGEEMWDGEENVNDKYCTTLQPAGCAVFNRYNCDD
jgi:hypothetical protein